MSFYQPIRDRNQLRATACGYISETAPLVGVSSTVALSAQGVRATSLGLRAGDVVTNIIVCVQTAAAGTAGVVTVGFYSAASALLASSADVQASFTSTGQKTLAVSTPYTVPADGLFYAAILMSTAYGTTQPAIMSAGGAGGSVALAGKSRPWWLHGGQASLPNPATPGDTSAAPWFAVS